MKGKRFAPKPGEVYQNCGGGTYRCLRSGGIVPARSAIMQNVSSKWTFVAVGCTLYPDGSMDWCYSSKGRMADTEKDVRDLHFELYKEAVESASAKIKDRILTQAAADPDIDDATLRRIAEAAHFSWD